MIIIAASCVFYGWWDLRFLGLLLGGSLADCAIGRRLGGTGKPRTRRILLGISLALNLGVLVYFKYVGFLVDSARHLLDVMGMPASEITLSIVLPVGISFFTLQRLSYVLDIYRGLAQPGRSVVNYLAAVTFFPLLLSGPIERPTRLLRQFSRGRIFDPQAASGGLRQILVGLFKKLVIADRLAPAVLQVFSDPASHSGSELAAGAALFGIQLYADFSGYSDLAIGCARLLGIRVMRNFAGPFFSRDIGEFWRRWHISLSTWFRDYIYTPLSWKTPLTARGRKFGFILVTFTASGLWHGASWNFVFWGLLHGLFFAPLVFGWIGPDAGENPAVSTRSRVTARARNLLFTICTFAGVSFAWILFRADTVTQAAQYLTRMSTTSWLPLPRFHQAIAISAVFLAIEWLLRRRDHPLADLTIPTPARWIIYLLLALGVVLLNSQGASPFIYTRF